MESICKEKDLKKKALRLKREGIIIEEDAIIDFLLEIIKISNRVIKAKME